MIKWIVNLIKNVIKRIKMAKDKAGVKHNIDSIKNHIGSIKTLLDELKGSESLSPRDEKLLDSMIAHSNLLVEDAKSIQDLSDDYYKQQEENAQKNERGGGHVGGFNDFDTKC